nr:DNA/RNA helicase domain-containing protein [uncultured Muribaculum sp.]
MKKQPQKYKSQAYRILLTRARQGLVIYVPEGNGRKTQEGFPEDPTRQPSFYDSTYKYFKSLCINEI